VPDLSGRLTRILTMIPYIQQHPGVRVRDLARYLSCAPETILVDLDAVLLCGVPPYLPSDYIGVVVEGERIHISFAEHFKRPINLTFLEALGLMLALRHLPLTRRGRQTAQTLRTKILKILPSRTRRGLRAAGRHMDVGPLHRGVQERVALLHQAINERREVHMEYYTASRDELTRRSLRPYGIIEHKGEWYVVGWCLLRDAERPFRVDRIRKLTLLETTFEPPASFSMSAYGAAEMYFPTRRDLRVKLRVSPELARWIKEDQPAKRTRELPDGGLILRLSVSQPEWIVSWVMAHAGQVELLAPEALRKKIVAACDQTLQNYA